MARAASILGNDAVALGRMADAGVDCRLVLHAGSNDRSLGLEQRDRLTLHIRAHQGAVCVVVRRGTG